MVLLLHIIIALSSVGYSVYTLFRPSRAKLNTSYMLMGFTVASGTYLTISKPGHMLEVCTMGLIYLAVTLCATVLARNKLVKQIDI